MQTAGSGFALILVLVLIVGNALGPERWWPISLNLYLPQAVWAAPFMLIACLGRKSRGRVAVVGVGLAIVFVPLMGLHVPLRLPAQVRHRVRVITFNVNEFNDQQGVVSEIVRSHADVILLQEARTLPPDFKKTFRIYRMAKEDDCVILSRAPLTDIVGQRLPSVGYGGGWTRGRLDVGSRQVTFYSVHLETPRLGILALRRDFVGGLRRFRAETQVRLAAARQLAERIQLERGPTVLAGDFNAPSPSQICSSFREGGLRDCFAVAGWGYGYTYGHTLGSGHSFVRIDQILVSREWRVEDCRTGSPVGSDHRPVIADLAL